MRFKNFTEACGDHKKKKKKKMDEGYTSNELDRLNNNWLINAQFRDDDGNASKWLGLNDKESLMALKKFVDTRLKNIKEIRKKMGY